MKSKSKNRFSNIKSKRKKGPRAKVYVRIGAKPKPQDFEFRDDLL